MIVFIQRYIKGNSTNCPRGWCSERNHPWISEDESYPVTVFLYQSIFVCLELQHVVAWSIKIVIPIGRCLLVKQKSRIMLLLALQHIVAWSIKLVIPIGRCLLVEQKSWITSLLALSHKIRVSYLTTINNIKQICHGQSVIIIQA